MSKLIYRFEIPIFELDEAGHFTLEMPVGSRILHLDLQDRAPHHPSMWVACDPQREPIEHHFYVIGTGHGHTAIDYGDHVGTFQQAGYVWHVYETTGRLP
jgi:hypothetical protein